MLKKKKVLVSAPCPGCVKNPNCVGAAFGGPECPPGSPQYKLAVEYKNLSKIATPKNKSQSPQNHDIDSFGAHVKGLFENIYTQNNSQALQEQEFINAMMSPENYLGDYQTGGQPKPYAEEYSFGKPAGWHPRFSENAHTNDVQTIVNGKVVWVKDDGRYNVSNENLTAEEWNNRFSSVPVDANVSGVGSDNYVSDFLKQMGGSVEDMQAFGYNPDKANLNPYLSQYQNLQNQNANMFQAFGKSLEDLQMQERLKMRTKYNPAFPTPFPDSFQVGGQFNSMPDYQFQPAGSYGRDAIYAHPKHLPLNERSSTRGKTWGQSNYSDETFSFPGVNLPQDMRWKVDSAFGKHQLRPWEGKDFNPIIEPEYPTQYNYLKQMYPWLDPNSGYTQPPQPPLLPETKAFEQSSQKVPETIPVKTPTVSTRQPVSRSQPKTEPSQKNFDDPVMAAEEVLQNTSKRRGNVFDEESSTPVSQATFEQPNTQSNNVQNRAYQTYLADVQFRRPFLRPGKQGAVKSMTFNHYASANQNPSEMAQSQQAPPENPFTNLLKKYFETKSGSNESLSDQDLMLLEKRLAGIFNPGQDPDGLSFRKRQMGGDAVIQGNSWMDPWQENEAARTQFLLKQRLQNGSGLLSPGMDFAAMLGRGLTEPDYQSEIQNRTSADNVFNSTYGNRGFNTVNKTGFDPVTNQTPVQFTGKYKQGGSYKLTDQEIRQFLAAGGEIEYLD